MEGGRGDYKLVCTYIYINPQASFYALLNLTFYFCVQGGYCTILLAGHSVTTAEHARFPKI